jgi:hypothetical protein
MLRARVVSEGIRATNPAVATGIYTPEEVMDMDDSPATRRKKEKDVTPLPPVEPRTVPELAEVLTAIAGMRTKPEREAAKALSQRLEDAEQIGMAEAAWATRIAELKQPAAI